MTGRIGITGATGELGGRVAQRLAQQGVELRLIVRDPARAPALTGAEVAVGVYDDPDSMRRATDGIDTLYLVSASETEDRLAHHQTAVRAVADAGVRRVVYTSFLGAAPDATFTLARDHFHTEQALREAGLSLVALRDSLYADYFPYFATDGVIRGPAGDGQLAPVTRDDIADVSVAALLDPDLHGTFDVTGPELLTMQQAAQIMSEVTGGTVRFEDETVEQAYASRAGYGAPQWQLDAWVSTYTAIAVGEMAVVSDTVQRLTGHPATPLRDFLAADQGRQSGAPTLE